MRFSKWIGGMTLGLAALCVGSPAAAEDISLKLVMNGSTRTVTFFELQRQIIPTELTVYSPVYEKPMSYKGFWLDDVLRILKIRLDEEDLIFEAADGYGTVFLPDEIGQRKWLLAFSETNGEWTPLPGHSFPNTPGPWYLIGSSPGSYQETPWPYQVTTLKTRQTFE